MRPDAPERDELPFDLPLDDQPGPATPLHPAAAARMVEGALEQARPAKRRRPVWLTVAAAAAVLLAAPAGAALWRYVRAPTEPPTPVKPAPRAGPAPQSDLLPEPPEPIREPEPPAFVAPEPTPEPEARPARRSGGRRRRPPPAPTPAPRTASAAELLDRASAARGARDFEAAAAAYAELLRRYPSSGAAYVARISAAAIALDHRAAPRHAAKLYRAAIAQRPGGPLDADARWGLARALRALGEHAAERATLQALVQEHTGSAYAAQARARLEALESP